MVDTSAFSAPDLSAPVYDEAVAWHLRLADMPGRDWDAFLAWLEASPDHRAAYDEVALADALAGEGLAAVSAVAPAPAPTPAPIPAPGLARGRWARLAGWQRGGLAMAVAASVAVVAAVGLWPRAEGLLIERTQAGVTKQLDFADGTRIDLNGDTALALNEADSRIVEVRQGEARFSVRHGSRPFTVSAGGFTLRDLGTVFNVQLSEASLVLDVTEGQVLFDPGGAAVTVGAGERLTVDRARNLVFKRAGAAPGDWLRGELAFDNATLGEVAAALHRRYGSEINLTEGLQARPFSGNVRFTGDPAKDVPHLARLIGADYRREGQGWIIAEAGSRR